MPISPANCVRASAPEGGLSGLSLGLRSFSAACQAAKRSYFEARMTGRGRAQRAAYQCKLTKTQKPVRHGPANRVGTWLSLVEHSLGVRGVGSSNLPVPTIILESINSLHLSAQVSELPTASTRTMSSALADDRISDCEGCEAKPSHRSSNLPVPTIILESINSLHLSAQVSELPTASTPTMSSALADDRISDCEGCEAKPGHREFKSPRPDHLN